MCFQFKCVLSASALSEVAHFLKCETFKVIVIPHSNAWLLCPNLFGMLPDSKKKSFFIAKFHRENLKKNCRYRVVNCALMQIKLSESYFC